MFEPCGPVSKPGIFGGTILPADTQQVHSAWPRDTTVSRRSQCVYRETCTASNQLYHHHQETLRARVNIELLSEHHRFNNCFDCSTGCSVRFDLKISVASQWPFFLSTLWIMCTHILLALMSRCQIKNKRMVNLKKSSGDLKVVVVKLLFLYAVAKNVRAPSSLTRLEIEMIKRMVTHARNVLLCYQLTFL